MKSADSTSKWSCIIKNAMTTGIELIWYELTSGKIWSVVKRLFPPPHSPSLTQHTNPHTYTITEAVVLFDYEKQQDDELSLKVGDIITDVKQVGEQYVHSTVIMWNTMFHTTCSCLKCYPTQQQQLQFTQCSLASFPGLF